MWTDRRRASRARTSRTASKARRCWVDVRVTDQHDVPVPQAVVDVWQSNSDGFYDVQLPELDGPVLRARFRTDDDGRLRFWTILPAAYPIPEDGPVGEMLDAAGRHPFRAPHVHFMIGAPGHTHLVTQLFLAGGDYLDSDTVFGVKPDSSSTSRHRTARRPTAGGSTRGRRSTTPSGSRDDRLRHRRPRRRQRPGRRFGGAAARHLRRADAAGHQVRLGGQHAPRAHHQPAHAWRSCGTWACEDEALAAGHAAAADGRHGAVHGAGRRGDRPHPHLGHRRRLGDASTPRPARAA